MKKTIFTLFLLPSLLVTSLSVPSLALAQEPINLKAHIARLADYHDSGDYEKDVERVIQKATHHLKHALKRKPFNGKKPAIVLDIDDTALSSYPFIAKMGIGCSGNLKQIIKAEERAEAPAILPTLKLYQFAKANQVAVIFITGRHEGKAMRAATAKNLQKAGYRDWDHLLLKPAHYHHKPAHLYKSATRKQLTESGYDIILNIGDQASDLTGRYARHAFKLPNPYYLIP